jgi:hypothetical protein
MACDYKRVMRGVVFYRSPCYYRVEAWDDTDQMWICLNLNSGSCRYFKEEDIAEL